MTEMSMRERVARAIAEVSGPESFGAYGLFDYSGQTSAPYVVRDLRRITGQIVFQSDDRAAARKEYDLLMGLVVADAVITAMRSPTIAMIQAKACLFSGDHSLEDLTLDMTDAEVLWAAAIDAALSEKAT